jgi:hypothetical protein
MFTFAGNVPYQDLLTVSDHLVQPFPRSRLVPISGWSWVTFNGILAFNPESEEVYTSDHLLEEVKCNPLCSDLHFLLPPRWMRPSAHISGRHSSFSFAFLDPDDNISHAMSQTHLAMFGKVITFRKWRPRPPLMQCGWCHKFSHLPPWCPLPKEAVRCPICGGNHRKVEHAARCVNAANHAGLGTCNCPIKCINCGKDGHSARDVTCEARIPFKTLAQNIIEATPPP